MEGIRTRGTLLSWQLLILTHNAIADSALGLPL